MSISSNRAPGSREEPEGVPEVVRPLRWIFRWCLSEQVSHVIPERCKGRAGFKAPFPRSQGIVELLNGSRVAQPQSRFGDSPEVARIDSRALGHESEPLDPNQVHSRIRRQERRLRIEEAERFRTGDLVPWVEHPGQPVSVRLTEHPLGQVSPVGSVPILHRPVVPHRPGGFVAVDPGGDDSFIQEEIPGWKGMPAPGIGSKVGQKANPAVAPAAQRSCGLQKARLIQILVLVQ